MYTCISICTIAPLFIDTFSRVCKIVLLLTYTYTCVNTFAAVFWYSCQGIITKIPLRKCKCKRIRKSVAVAMFKSIEEQGLHFFFYDVQSNKCHFIDRFTEKMQQKFKRSRLSALLSYYPK